jgi:phosphate:Na+ symporter
MPRSASRPLLPALLALALLLPASPGWAQPAGGQAAPPMDWFDLAMGCTAGLALFLLGVALLADGLRAAAGDRAKRLLGHATDGPLRGLLTGTAATTLLDSSSVTIILLIGLVDAGLVGFAQALPVILGSNIGTTVSSQIFALGIEDFAPILLALGLLAPEPWRHWGLAVAGLGLVLFGLGTLGEAVKPLQDQPGVTEWLRSSDAPLRGMLIGAAFTLLIQSSSATLGVVITLASQGLIDLPTGLAMMLGAEIGTCSDTLLATLGRSRAAVRAALFHLGFNIVSVAAGLLLIDALAGFAAWSAGDTAQQIANAHVAFNTAGALLCLYATPALARWMDRLLPDGRAGRPATAAAE